MELRHFKQNRLTIVATNAVDLLFSPLPRTQIKDYNFISSFRTYRLRSVSF